MSLTPDLVGGDEGLHFPRKCVDWTSSSSWRHGRGFWPQICGMTRILLLILVLLSWVLFESRMEKYHAHENNY